MRSNYTVDYATIKSRTSRQPEVLKLTVLSMGLLLIYTIFFFLTNSVKLVSHRTCFSIVLYLFLRYGGINIRPY